MDPVVILGTRAHGLTVLDLKRTGAAPPDEALFEVTSDGLSAATWVYDYPDFARFVAFLTGMERDWRGWDGARDWANLEGQLAITAEHTGVHVTIRVTMERFVDWKVRADMTVGPGEDITNAVLAAKSLFA